MRFALDRIPAAVVLTLGLTLLTSIASNVAVAQDRPFGKPVLWAGGSLEAGAAHWEALEMVATR